MRCRYPGPKVCTLATLLLLMTGGGCASHAIDRQIAMAEYADIPRELDKMSFPSYRVEPPDILQLEAVNNIRPADAPLDSGDVVTVRLQKGLPIVTESDPVEDALEYQYELEHELANKIVNGDFLIGADGAIDLGPAYGKVPIAGLNLDQARDAVIYHLQQDSIGIKNPVVTMTLPDVSGKQPITGEHLVRPDGTVSLGVYGSVNVAGRTMDEVKRIVEQHLRAHINEPEVRVDVLAYNSKAF